MSTPIVELFGQVVDYMRSHDENGKVIPDPTEAPYYMFGHRQEIANRLKAMEGNGNKYQKYPLVALRMDLVEDHTDGLTKVQLNVLILTRTKKEDWAPERYEKVFKPILYPLYERLKVALRDSGIFFWPGDQTVPPHKKIDRPYWGESGKEANTANFLNDIIDAIELIDLKLNTSNTLNC